LSILKG